MKNIIVVLLGLMVTMAEGVPVKSILSARATSTTSASTIPTAKDYIQDGLIAMWDGIENAGWGVHDENATEWYDLVNGTHNIIPNASAVYSWGENYFHFGGKGRAYVSNYIDIYKSLTNGEITIQCVIKDISDWTYIETGANAASPIFGGTYRTFSIFKKYSSNTKTIECYLAHSMQTATPLEYDKNFLYTATLFGNVQTSWINEIRKGTYTHSRSPSSENIGFGLPIAGWGGTPWLEDIYAIRIYSKALTEKEIAYNFKIDKVRFNLP